MDDIDGDIDLDLLESLMEAAENTEKAKSKDKPGQPDFSSVLENLDEIPVKAPVKRLSLKQEEGKKKASDEKSLIHSGDTDSEDDEERKYFHKTQFNDCGSSIKRLLKAEEASPGFDSPRSSPGCSKSWKTTPKPPASRSLCFPTSEAKQANSTDLNIDALIGVRVVNPLVSSVVLSERLNGRSIIPFCRVKDFVTAGKIREDWVIVGVIVSKSPPRTSAKGSTYSIVRLSDLRGLGDMKTVSVFLFSSSCKTHGKNSVGTVLGILNPGTLDNSKTHGDEACLSVDSADKIMVLGKSRDFALCRSKKKNGENCTSFVNKANCDYCIYHVKQEYQQFSRRTELQASYTGKGLPGGLTGLRNKVLGKSEVFYAGQSYTAIPAKKNTKMVARDSQRLSVLSGMQSAALKSQAGQKSRLATSVELSHRQAQKDIDRLRKLDALDFNDSSDKRPLVNASSHNYAQHLEIDKTKTDTLAFISKARDEAASKPPKSDPGEDISEPSTIRSIKERSSSQLNSVSVSTPKTPAVMSRGAAFALAATQKKVEAPKNNASAFGLGSKCDGDGSPARNLQQNSSPVTVTKEKCDQALKLKKQEPDAAIQKTPAQLKILAKLMEKRGTPKVVEEPVSPTITKASDLGLGLGRRVQVKSNTIRTTPCLNKSVPTLGVGVSPLGGIEFDISVSPKNCQNPDLIRTTPCLKKSASTFPYGGEIPVSPKNCQSAKLKALSYVRRNGSITKEDPNKLELANRKKTVAGVVKQKQPKKRKIEEVLETSGVTKKKTKNEEEAKLKEKMAEFKALMEISSKHADLVTKADNEAQEEYFNNLEKKEKLEEKMLNTYKVACKAVTCTHCKYTAFSASDLCKEQRHPLKVHDATKRFFKCADCGNRTCCLEIIPLKSCSNCNSSRWERTAMIREKKVGIGSETLSVRGGEEKFIGSVVTGANINLLVPD